MYPIHSVNDVRDERFNISDMENTISLKIMNNDNENSPRHFLKIPDGKLTIHFIRPYIWYMQPFEQITHVHVCRNLINHLPFEQTYTEIHLINHTFPW